MPINKTYTSNTLYNDSTGVIAFAEQLKQELINWANYHHVTEELGPGNRPDTQNALNNLFLSVYERFLTFLNDADATKKTINTWKEIENFLADYTDEKTLAEIVSELNANIESRLTVPLESTTGSSTTSTMTQKAITETIDASKTFTTGEKVNSMGIDGEPTAGSNNLVKSGGVQNELALGAVYDVSAKNPTAGPNSDGKWASLSALLSDANLNTLIPTSVRKGGMSIKFVQSSDNKYVQYMYLGTSTTDADFTNVANWQKVNVEKEVITSPLISFLDVASNSIDFNFVVGTLTSSGQEQDSSTRCRSKYFSILKGTTIHITNGYKCWVFEYDNNLDFVTYSGNPLTGDLVYNSNSPFIRLRVAKTSDTPITAEEAINAVSCEPLKYFNEYKEAVAPQYGDSVSTIRSKSQKSSSEDLETIFSGEAKYEFEIGSISGAGTDLANTNRIRTISFHRIINGCKLIISNGYKARVYLYNDDGTYSGNDDWQTGEYIYSGLSVFARFVLSRIDDTDMQLSEVSNLKIIPSHITSAVKENSEKTGIIIKINNLANPSTITQGAYMTAASTVYQKEGTFYTDYIPVNVGDVISVLGGFTHITSFTQNDEGHFSTVRGTDVAGNRFTIPQGSQTQAPIKFIRVSGNSSTLPAMIYKGNFDVPYIAYGATDYFILSENIAKSDNGFASLPLIKRSVPILENIKDYNLTAMDNFVEEIMSEKSDLAIPMMTDIHTNDLEPYEMMAYLAKAGQFDGVFTLGDYIPERYDTKAEAVALLSSVLGAEYSFPYRTKILYALKGNHDNNPTRAVVNVTLGTYTEFTPNAGSSTPFPSLDSFKGTIATGGSVYLLGTSTPAIRGTNYDFTIVNSDACVYDYDYYNLSELRTKPGDGVTNKAYGFIDFERAKVRVIYLDANDIYVNDVPMVYAGNCMIQNEQMNWFANIALDFTDKKIPTDWSVILLLHCAMANTEESAFASILDAFTTGGQVMGTYTRNVVGYSNVITLNKDYSAQGALTFICSVSGHHHIDYIRKLVNKYTEVGICCDNQTAGKSGNPTIWYNRTPGTIEEHAIDCLLLDKAHRKVYFKRLGIGDDREIEY